MSITKLFAYTLPGYEWWREERKKTRGFAYRFFFSLLSLIRLRRRFKGRSFGGSFRPLRDVWARFPLGGIIRGVGKAKAPQREAYGAFRVSIMLAPAYFPTYKYAVSSAMRSLTTGFGMGPGVPSSLWAPANICSFEPIPVRKTPARSGSQEPIYSIEGLERNFFDISRTTY